MIIYLSCKMRGVKDLNFPALDRYAQKWRGEGNTVISPADLDRERKIDNGGEDVRFEDVIPEDVLAVAQMADAVAMIPGWESSKGALIELLTASACTHHQKAIVSADDLRPLHVKVTVEVMDKDGKYTKHCHDIQ